MCIHNPSQPAHLLLEITIEISWGGNISDGSRARHFRRPVIIVNLKLTVIMTIQVVEYMEEMMLALLQSSFVLIMTL